MSSLRFCVDILVRMRRGLRFGHIAATAPLNHFFDHSFFGFVLGLLRFVDQCRADNLFILGDIKDAHTRRAATGY